VAQLGDASWNPLHPLGIRSVVFSGDGALALVAYQAIPRAGTSPPPVVAFRTSDMGVEWKWASPGNVGVPVISTSLVELRGRGQVALATLEGGRDADGVIQRHSRLWILDDRTGRVVRSIDHVQSDRVTALTASRDGRLLATASTTGNREVALNLLTRRPDSFENHDPIRIWNAESGDIAKEIPVTSPSEALAFTPDGKYLVACQPESVFRSVLRVWDLASGHLVQELENPPELGTAWGLEFSPKDNRLAAAGGALALFQYDGA
jgi:hypothetical protein